MTGIWVVQTSNAYSGRDGRDWNYEDLDSIAERGYFTSKDEATAWIDAEKKRHLDEGRAKFEIELDRKNQDARRRYEEKTVRNDTVRREYDVLVAAGITPSFDLPKDRAPFKPSTPTFDEQVYLRGLGLDWDVYEIRPHPKEEST